MTILAAPKSLPGPLPGSAFHLCVHRCLTQPCGGLSHPSTPAPPSTPPGLSHRCLHYRHGCPHPGPSQLALVVKNPPASAGDIRDTGSIPGSGRSLGGGHGNPLQYSCLENPMDRGAFWATVHRITKNQTRMKRLGMHTHPPLDLLS